MKKITILLLACFIFSSIFAQEVQTLRERIYEEYYNNSTGNAGHLSTLQSNGLWADINYADRSITNWDPIKHLQRIRAMAKSYSAIADKQSTSAQQLLVGIENALNAWYNGNYRSDNWFFNDIGQQREIGPILALSHNHLQPSTITKACAYLTVKQISPGVNHSGTNLVWMASMVMIRGAVQNDLTLIAQSVAQIGSTVNPVVKGREGIQKDNAYLYHGLQIYNGGYGNWFINDVSLWFYLTRGLSIGFSVADIGYLRGLILDGDQWMIRRGQYDFGTTGRNITRRWQIASSGLKTPAERMKGIDPENSTRYQALIDHINGSKNDNLVGNKQFFRSDYMIQRRPGYFLSVKMCSSRTNGTEFMNGENAKGYWLPFGATCLMKDAAEYNSIFPLWDWTKVPGVTSAEETPAFGVVLNQSTSFVGGVSNGSSGVATMDQNTRSVTAKKAWFMFDNETVALGAGITSINANSITTSLAQSVKRNHVYVNDKFANEAIGGSHNKVKTIWHDNVAYVFPDSTNIKLTNSFKVGAWFDINTSQPKDVITNEIFNPWIDHGKNPSNASYTYIIVPEITRTNLPAYVADMSVTVLQNNAQIQAVTHSVQKLTGIVFYIAGQLKIDNGLSISVNQPCAVLVDQSSEPTKISISDPMQNKVSIAVTLNFTGFPVETINFTMPTGDLTGSTITRSAQTIRDANYQAVSLTRVPISPLSKGETFQVEKQFICNNCTDIPHKWYSLNEAVATVNQQGVITALANGEATIGIRLTESLKTQECTVEVMEIVLTENFDHLQNLILLPGGTWSVDNGNLRLNNPIGANIPSPENNLALINQNIIGDFVLSANMFVDETASVWNDVCLIWNHQYPENSYYYAHLCENNDDAGSGIFKISNGQKSTQLVDIPIAFEAGKWNNVILKIKNNKAEVFLNYQLIATYTNASMQGGKIGFGTYNDLCRFDDVVIWQSVGSTSVKTQTNKHVSFKLHENIITIDNNEAEILNIFDITGKSHELLCINNSVYISSLPNNFKGVLFVRYRMFNTVNTLKIMSY